VRQRTAIGTAKGLYSLGSNDPSAVIGSDYLMPGIKPTSVRVELSVA
jgi:hypothetical protein